MRRERLGAMVTISLTVVLVGCVASGPVTPTTRPLPRATATDPPTETSSPAHLPQPTATSRPTKTAFATDAPSTATPTSSPEPTPTSIPTQRPSPTPTVDLTSIGSVTASRVGEKVTVEGMIVATDSFSHGFKLTMDDGQGQILLLMWHDVYDACPDRTRINVGVTVRASGEVGQYEGQLQIEPRLGDDVKAIQPSATEAPWRAIGSIDAGDEGQRVMVEGEVLRTEGLPTAVKVFLKDDHPAAPGEIMIFVWRNVLDRITDNVGLGTPGSRVRVVGRVQIYRDNLEIVPALPSDVTVLEIP